MGQNENPENKIDHSLKEKISGLGQKIVGEIEEIGGALTGDPLTIAEGELNVEVGDIRDEMEKEEDEGGK
ncbi:MAG: CsbD family protein [Acidobacteria bacterium]|nr:CsbD family protein [Acidobacteriota bacterium]